MGDCFFFAPGRKNVVAGPFRGGKSCTDSSGHSVGSSAFTPRCPGSPSSSSTLAAAGCRNGFVWVRRGVLGSFLGFVLGSFWVRFGFVGAFLGLFLGSFWVRLGSFLHKNRRFRGRQGGFLGSFRKKKFAEFRPPPRVPRWPVGQWNGAPANSENG